MRLHRNRLQSSCPSASRQAQQQHENQNESEKEINELQCRTRLRSIVLTTTTNAYKLCKMQLNEIKNKFCLQYSMEREKRGRVGEIKTSSI